jgi:ferredoxin-thioredoxin reductase catalytic subunit
VIKVVTNSDKNLVKEIREKIKKNDGHCACAITFDDDNMCMCKDFREQIKEGKSGECHCGLYILTVE